MANAQRTNRKPQRENAPSAAAEDSIAELVKRENEDDPQDDDSIEEKERLATQQVAFQRFLGSAAVRYKKEDHIVNFLKNLAYNVQGARGSEEMIGEKLSEYDFRGIFVTANTSVYLTFGKLFEDGLLTRAAIEDAYEELVRLRNDAPHFLLKTLIPDMLRIDQLRADDPNLDPYSLEIKKHYDRCNELNNEYRSGQGKSPTLGDKWPEGQSKPHIF